MKRLLESCSKAAPPVVHREPKEVLENTIVTSSVAENPLEVAAEITSAPMTSLPFVRSEDKIKISVKKLKKVSKLEKLNAAFQD